MEQQIYYTMDTLRQIQIVHVQIILISEAPLHMCGGRGARLKIFQHEASAELPPPE